MLHELLNNSKHRFFSDMERHGRIFVLLKIGAVVIYGMKKFEFGGRLFHLRKKWSRVLRIALFVG